MNDNYPDIDAPGATKGHIFDHNDPTGTGDLVGEGVGGISGGVTGLAVGALGGPVGMVLGAVAGVLGGWWLGRTIAASTTRLNEIDRDYFARRHDEMTPVDSDYTYEEAEPAYMLGKVAALNPDYRGRSFADLEPDLRRGWAAANTSYGWDIAGPAVRTAFEATRDPKAHGLPVATEVTTTVERTDVFNEGVL